VDFAASVDRHENLEEGFIWPREKPDSFENLSHFLQVCADRHLDVILETPNRGILKDLENLSIIAQQIATNSEPTFHLEI
jgi:endonuclease IV